MAFSSYTGRFAPSPTGPLHKGSLLAALASFLDARANHGQWLVRIEDIDPPREIPGAADQILRQLESHSLHWDGQVLHQSSRLSDYQNALNQLSSRDLLYACYCNRARLRTIGGCYDNVCRSLTQNTNPFQSEKSHSIRIKIRSQRSITLKDLIQKPLTFNLNQTGDFIVRRRDLLPAYHLATSLDDSYQGITHVIRGGDLLDSTPRQAYLLQCLNLDVPKYGHIPVLANLKGQKLSKQNHAPELDIKKAPKNLLDCLALLGIPAPPELRKSSPAQILIWAVENWQLSKVPSQPMVTESDSEAFLSQSHAFSYIKPGV